MAWKLQVVLFILAVPLNLTWEVAQIGAYDFPEGSLLKNVIGCFVPSLGDGLMTLMIYWSGWTIFRNSRWILHPGAKGYLLLVALGIVLALVVEWNALYRTGAWGYNSQMVTIALLGVGFLPVLQMIILPIVTVVLLQWIWNRQGRTLNFGRGPRPAVILLLAGTINLVGFGPSDPAPSENDPGRLVYEVNCAICHGIGGDGKGMAAHHFRTRPANFRTGRFKFRSTPSGSLPLDEDLFRTITQGVGGTGMIPQTHLDEGHRWAVVAYIKTLSPRFQEERSVPGVAIPPAPARTPKLVARGKQIYMDAGCSDCHGEGGKGDGPSAGRLQDDWGNPIAPADLTRLPWKSGQTPQDLYRTIANGLDGTPMPSYANALTPDEMWAVVAHTYGLPPKDEWENLGKLVEEEIIGFNVERMHRRPLLPREPEDSSRVPPKNYSNI